MAEQETALWVFVCLVRGLFKMSVSEYTHKCKLCCDFWVIVLTVLAGLCRRCISRVMTAMSVTISSSDAAW